MVNMASAKEAGDILVAKSNCGVPEFVDGEIHYTGTPEIMAAYACMARDAGVRIIGGCCGTTADTLSGHARRPVGPTRGGRSPSLELIVACLGAISTGASEQQQAGGLLQRPKREGRRRGRRREAGSEDTPRF